MKSKDGKNFYVRECELVYRRRMITTLENHKLEDSAVAVHVLRGLNAHVRAAESLWVLMLSTRQHMLGLHEVARGTTRGVRVDMADLFRAPIAIGAAGVVLAHNHPSGNPEPSQEDYVFTRRAVTAGFLLGIAVLDHIVLGETEHFSFQDSGNMPDKPEYVV